MASSEALSVLKQGVEAWNRWKREVNLDGAPDLDGIRFAGANFAGIVLWKAGLKNADLRGVNFGGANLSRTVLREVNFSGAILEGANLEQAQLWRTIFADVDLRDRGLAERLYADLQSKGGALLVRSRRPEDWGQ